MTLQRNHYDILGVSRTATTDEIKKKYRELARKFHPDIAKDKDMGQKIFSQINQAYRVLGDPDRRARYDAGQSADSAGQFADGAGVKTRNGATPGGPGSPQPQSGQSAAGLARLLEEAETAMLQNNAGKVKSICELVLKTDPRSFKALTLFGDALVQIGSPLEAAAAYRQALQIAPSAVLQAKLNRLTGTPPNGNGAAARPASNGAVPRTQPPANGAGASGQNRTDQGRTTTDQGRAEKPGGGLLSRLLGKK